MSNFVKSDDKYAVNKMSKYIYKYISNTKKQYNGITIICIGTDRSTGDCLGPLVGYNLSKSKIVKNVTLYGTLNEPVHAKNLEECYGKIDINNLIIAIDASLGKMENIGKIHVFEGQIYPGAGVGKQIIPVGDICITGIVNFSGFMEYIVLQNTKLSMVMQMANIISKALQKALKQVYKNSEIETEEVI